MTPDNNWTKPTAYGYNSMPKIYNPPRTQPRPLDKLCRKCERLIDREETYCLYHKPFPTIDGNNDYL